MLLNSSLLQKIIIVSVVLISSCTLQGIKPTTEEIIILQKALENVPHDYSNPRLVTGELTVKIAGIEALTGAALKADNQQNHIPPDQSPSLHIWSSSIRDYPTQKMVSEFSTQPQPDHHFVDSIYGNQIQYWNPSLERTRDLTITRRFSYITFDFKPVVDRKAERSEWSQIPLEIIESYTMSEPFLEQEDILIDTVFQILENIANPVDQAETIYNWVQKSMTYVYPPEQRGVQNAFKTLCGDCGQYTALFITMARIAGIPARQQSGFNFTPDNTGAHVWSEIYLPVKGWVPVDATRDDGFLHLDNGRLITSIGLNIPLEKTPAWATYENSEVEDGHTDFMQMFTLVSCGVTADYRIKRIVTRSVGI